MGTCLVKVGRFSLIALVCWGISTVPGDGRAWAQGGPPGSPQASTAGGERIELPRELAEEFMKGVEATKKHDWAAAAKHYDRLLEKRPDFQPARLLRGTALLLQGKKTEGDLALTHALGADLSPEELILVAQQLDPSPGPRPGEVSALSRPYWERCLGRARSLGYEQARDVEKLEIVAIAALELGRDPEFRTAASNIVRWFPDAMQSHYFNAIRAARDREWVTSEDELRRAEQLGLPKETVDRMLASGLHSRASTWRYLYYALYAALAWVLGLVGLFVLGKGLSLATLRSAQTDDPNAAITPLQRALRRTYRGIINFAGLYYYISLPFIAVLAIAAAFGLIYVVLLLPRIPVKLLGIVIVFGLAMLATIWSSIRSLFVRIKDEDPGRALGESEVPRLWDLAREVAARVGTRPVDVIYMTPGTELAVFERGRWFDKLRDRARRALILGQGVVDGFDLDAFRAVLAHEYGHFLHRDTAGGDVALRVNATMGRFAVAMIQQGNAQWWNIGWHFVRLYHWLFRRITHGASRLQEINADRVAARAYGKQAFEEGLRHVIRRDVAERYRVAMADEDAGFESRVEATPASHLTAPASGSRAATMTGLYRRAEVRRMIAADVQKIWEAGSTEEDTHPSPVERARLLGRLRTEMGQDSFGADEASPSAHWLADLFGEPGQWRATREEAEASEAKTRAESRRTYLEALIGQIDAYLAENPGLAGPIRDRGLVRMQLHDYAQAVADFTEAIRRGVPERAVCYYQRGMSWANMGELEMAAADLRESMRLDPSLESQRGDGHIELGDVLLRSGQVDEAVAEFTCALELEPDRLGIYLRRGDAHGARGDLPAAEADYSLALERDPHCAEALASRSLVRSSMGRDAEAREDARAALIIEPSLRDIYPSLGTALLAATSH
jgi:tetratricopeptide (TPR) repeat protein